MEILMKISICV